MSYPIERFAIAEDTGYAVGFIEDLGLSTFPQSLYVYNRKVVVPLVLSKEEDGMRWYSVDIKQGRNKFIWDIGNGKPLEGVILSTEYEQLKLF